MGVLGDEVGAGFKCVSCDPNVVLRDRLAFPPELRGDLPEAVARSFANWNEFHEWFAEEVFELLVVFLKPVSVPKTESQFPDNNRRHQDSFRVSNNGNNRLPATHQAGVGVGVEQQFHFQNSLSI